MKGAALEFRPIAKGKGLPGPQEAGDFSQAIAEVAETEQFPPWCAYLGWKDGHAVVFGSFKGAPNPDGEVEIGYLTFAEHEGKGLAKAAAAFLVDVAREAGAQCVIADTLPQDNPSTGVLLANGFARHGCVEDHEIGRAWRWRLVL